MPLAAAVVLLVLVTWAMRASWHGQTHAASRLAAAIGVTAIALFGYDAYRGRANVVIAVILAAFALIMLSLAMVKGRFRATPR